MINSVIFIMFAFTFFKPRTSRDWRSFGAFSAFLVALLTCMMTGGRIWGMGLTSWLVVLLLLLAIAAPVKYVFFKQAGVELRY